MRNITIRHHEFFYMQYRTYVKSGLPAVAVTRRTNTTVTQFPECMLRHSYKSCLLSAGKLDINILEMTSNLESLQHSCKGKQNSNLEERDQRGGSNTYWQTTRWGKDVKMHFQGGRLHLFLRSELDVISFTSSPL
jgi:hypothetical protein